LAFDFHKSLTEKIARLSPSTPTTRRAVYETARENLLAHVRAAAPSIPVAAVIAQQRALEEAILAIETEARRHDPPAPPPPPVPKRKPPEPQSAAKDESALPAPAVAEGPVEAAAHEQATPEQVPDLTLVAELSAPDPGPPPPKPPAPPAEPEPLLDVEQPADEEDQQIAEAVFQEPERPPAPAAGAPWKVAIYVATAGLIGATIVFAAALTWRAIEKKPPPPVKPQIQATTKAVEAPPAASALISGAGFSAAAQTSFKQGVGLLAQGELDRAILAFDDAIRLDPTQPAAYGNRAFAHWRKGAAELAARDYSDALRLDPKNLQYRLNRAIANNRVGNYETAVADLDEVIRVEPENPSALNSRCWARAMLGALEEALADCNQAVRLAPKDASTLDGRGFVHLKSGRLVRAVADYSSALRIDPKLASSLYGRGLAKIGRGDRAGGSEDVAAAKALNPDIQAEFARYGIR
jgi:tetratricopeptide (TPR) repeat protein